MKSASALSLTSSFQRSICSSAKFLAVTVASRDSATMSLSACRQRLSESSIGGTVAGVARSVVAHPANATTPRMIKMRRVLIKVMMGGLWIDLTSFLLQIFRVYSRLSRAEKAK
jgi:hypothetical protein